MRQVIYAGLAIAAVMGLGVPRAEARLGAGLVEFVQKSGFSDAEAVPTHEQLQGLVDVYCQIHPGGTAEEGRMFDIALAQNLYDRGSTKEMSTAIAVSLSWLRRRYGCDRVVSDYDFNVGFMDALPEMRYSRD